MKRHPAPVLLTAVVLLLAVPRLSAGWEPPVELAHNDTACYLPLANCWALAAAGETLHAVWYDQRSGGFEVYHRRSLDRGTTWDPETRLTADTVYSGYPAVAASGPNVHVVWVQGVDARGDSGDQVYYVRSTDAGFTWLPPVQLSHSAGGYYGGWFPCVAAWGANVHVVWEDDRYSDDQIFYRRSTDNGASWNQENPIENYPGMVNASLAVAGNTLHVAYYGFWTEVVYFQRSTNNGTTWSPRTAIPTPDVSDSPCVAASDSAVHLAFCDGRNGHWDVWYRRSTDAGVTWSADTCIAPDLYQTWTVNLAVSGANVHAVRGDMGGYQVHYLRSTDAGLTWGPERTLSESVPGGDAMHYSVCAADSTVHVLFDKERYVYYRRNRGGNPVALAESGPAPAPLRLGPTVVRGPLGRSRLHPGPWECFDHLGRRVGVFGAAESGTGLPAGIYYVRSVTGPGRVRVVKVR